MPEMKPPWAGTSSPLANNDRGDDWIRNRDVECASPTDQRSLAAHAWQRQRSYVADRSAFYRRKLAGAANLADLEFDDLSRLPLTEKSELQDTQSRATAFGDHLAAAEGEIARVYETSGTTGSPTRVALTPRDLATWLTVGSRTYRAASVRPHNSVVSIFGAQPFVVGYTYDVIRHLGARVEHTGPLTTADVESALREGTADTLLATPSFMLHLTAHLGARSIDPRRLNLIHAVVGGEPGGALPAVRTLIESSFGAALTEVMGLGDIAPSLFGECPAQMGMHFAGQGLVWPELIDDHGNPVAIEAGASGEMAYTHLQREAMPLIRFRSGDHVRILTTGCPCGRTSFTMRVEGRTDDMFIVRGVNVYPSAVQAIVAEFTPEVTGRIRVVVPDGAVTIEPPVQIVAELRSDSPPIPGLADRISDALRTHLRFRSEVALVTHAAFGSAAYKTTAVTRPANKNS